MHPNSSKSPFQRIRLLGKIFESRRIKDPDLEEQHQLNVAQYTLRASSMAAMATILLRCLISSSTVMTQPDRIHEWISLWKTDG